MTRATRFAVAGLLLTVLSDTRPLSAQDQRFQPGRGGGRVRTDQLDFAEINAPYDGRFTFVRLMFSPLCCPPRDYKWDHDYPRAERNFMRILDEVTSISPYLDGGNVLAMDDPEIFRYPVAYLSEPGFWTMTEAEEENLRNYLYKGGFLILDDLAGFEQWWNAVRMLERLLPDLGLVQLDATHPIFDSFFRIESLDMDHPNFFGFKASFWGIFEDNDLLGRPLVIVNRDNDIGDYWEWSDAGFIPIEISNEAYKLGVNYIVYAMTH